MKGKTTLVLLTITAAVFAYIYYFDQKRPNTQEAERQAHNLLNISPEKIDGIVIQNGDDKIELRRHDKTWRLEAPIKDQADGSLVESLLSDVSGWDKETTIS